MKEKKLDYYSGEEVRNKNADYTLVIGMRSNGKSYDFLSFLADEYILHNKQFVYLRKSDIETRANKVTRAMANMETYIKKKYGSTWRVRCYAGEIQMYTEGEKDFQCMGYVMNNFAWQSYKGNSYPGVYYILFDEFTSKLETFSDLYGEDEVESFFQNVSTVIRNRTDVKIFMLGNTVSRESKFFKAFKIDAYKLKKGSITTFETDTGLKVAIEYCKDSEVASKSSKFFTFAKSSKMITSGEWEVEPFQTSWKGNNVIDMLKWKHYLYWIRIEREGGYHIVISTKSNIHPVIIAGDVAHMHRNSYVYTSLREAMLSNKKLRDIIMWSQVKNNILITDTQTAERWYYDLRKK